MKSLVENNFGDLTPSIVFHQHEPQQNMMVLYFVIVYVAFSY